MNGDAQLAVHRDTDTNTESVFIAFYDMTQEGQMIEMSKMTYVNEVQTCPGTAENTLCNRKQIDYRTQVVAASAISANVFQVLIYIP